MTTTTSATILRDDPYRGYRHTRPVLLMSVRKDAQACEKCGMHMLYHDLDPQRRHNGYTCGACGCEQTLADGTKSSIKVARS